MKKLSLKTEPETIKLLKGEAQCNFCGEEDKECIMGSVELEVEYPVYKTRIKSVVEDYEYLHYLFGKTKKVVLKESYENVITETNCEKKSDKADICLDCIKQLAQLTKQNEQPNTNILRKNNKR